MKQSFSMEEMTGWVFSLTEPKPLLACPCFSPQPIMKSNWNISPVCAQKILGLEVILVCRLSDEGYTRNYGQLSGSWLLLCWNCKVCMVMIISFSVSGIDYLWNKMIYSQGEYATKFILRVFLEHQGQTPWLIGLLPNLLVLAVPSSSGCMKFRYAHLLLSTHPMGESSALPMCRALSYPFMYTCKVGAFTTLIHLPGGHQT